MLLLRLAPRHVQAAVCGGALALEVAGVPTACRVAGISVGLVCENTCAPAAATTPAAKPGEAVWEWPAETGRYALLTGGWLIRSRYMPHAPMAHG